MSEYYLIIMPVNYRIITKTEQKSFLPEFLENMPSNYFTKKLLRNLVILSKK